MYDLTPPTPWQKFQEFVIMNSDRKTLDFFYRHCITNYKHSNYVILHKQSKQKVNTGQSFSVFHYPLPFLTPIPTILSAAANSHRSLLSLLLILPVGQVSEGSPISHNCLVDDFIGLLPALELEHLHFLPLQLFVILEEAMDLVEDVLGQLLDVGVVRDGFVVIGHRDDLVVLLALVDHAHHADDLRVDQAQRLDLGRADDQDVEGVVVEAVGLRDEAVVGGVVHCAEEHAIQLEQSGLLVQLILDLAFSGDLDHRGHHLRSSASVGDRVPGVGSEARLLAWGTHQQQLILFLENERGLIGRKLKWEIWAKGDSGEREQKGWGGFRSEGEI